MEPIVLRSHIATYPFFVIQDCIQFFDGVLNGNNSSIIATYEPSNNEWQYHDVTTVRKIVPSGVLLYCALPEGIAGGRITNCPRLQEEISYFHRHPQCSPTVIPNAQNRRWPSSYSYDEIIAGMRQYTTLRNVYSPGESFHRTFPHSRYAETTFRRHHKIFVVAEEACCSWIGTWDSFVESCKITNNTVAPNMNGWSIDDLAFLDSFIG